MKKTLFLFVLFGILGIEAEEWDPPNLVTNPGFEEVSDSGLPTGWNGDQSVYSRDTAVAHSGEASLKFVNADAEKYVLCSQRLPFEVGKKYEFSAWVKSEGIAGEDHGATLCIEYIDADGKWVGGAYCRTGVKGTTDWTLLEGVSAPVPEGVVGGTVACYLRKGMTGTAWWDEVEVREHRDDPLAIKLLSPNYRGEVTDAGPEAVRVVAETGNLRDYPVSNGDVTLHWTITNADDGAAVASGTQAVSASLEDVLHMPGASLEPGRYTIAVELRKNDTDEVISSKSCEVVRLVGIPQRTAYIDEHNRLIYEGKPFFPLGMYWGSVDEESIGVFADSPFNCLMPYHMLSREDMDLVDAHGLKVIYSVKDCYAFLGHLGDAIKTEADEQPFITNKVESLRDHPALLAWYLNDEAPLTQLDRLILHKEWVEELDPNHPTWSVLYQIGEIGGYFDTCHAIGTDPYPIPEKPAAMAGEWTRKTVEAMHGARPVWMVPQVFNWGAYREEKADQYRQPTIEEVRNMTWQCIAEGANGLIFYSWFNMYLPQRNAGLDFESYWPQFKTVVQEVKDMTPALLSVDEPPAITTDDAEWLNWTVKQVGTTTYLIAVNNSPEPQETTFTLPFEPATVTRFGTDKAIPMAEPKSLRLAFDPLGVWLCEIGDQ